MIDEHCIDQQIETFRDDQRANVQVWEDALAIREAALAEVDTANAVMAQCRERIDQDKGEIDRLLEERAQIPKARAASE